MICLHYSLFSFFVFNTFLSYQIAMERWFSTGKRRSPVTNEILTDRSTQLTPNKVMKTMIQNYRRDIGTKLIAACKITSPSNKSTIDNAAEEDPERQSSNSQSPPARPISSLALAAYIEAGADVNVRDEDGNTPLMLLLQTGRIRLAREILEYGARAGQRNDLGTSPVNLCEKLREAGYEVVNDGNSAASSKTTWDEMINTLETISAREAINDEAKEKERNANTKAARERATELEREESRGGVGNNAAEAMSVADALRRAHIGPGIGFFPSLFALQFQGGMVPPLSRPDLANAGPGEVYKLQVIDKLLKGLLALAVIYLVFVV